MRPPLSTSVSNSKSDPKRTKANTLKSEDGWFNGRQYVTPSCDHQRSTVSNSDHSCRSYHRLHLRRNQHHQIRRWTTRAFENTRTVYARIRSNVRVCQAARGQQQDPDSGRFFMSIGSVIRTDASPMAMEAYARAHRRPIVLPRNYAQFKNEPRAN